MYTLTLDAVSDALDGAVNADALRRTRVALGLTQAEFAVLLGMDTTRVARMERGVRPIRPEKLLHWALVGLSTRNESTDATTPKTRSGRGSRDALEHLTSTTEPQAQ